VQKLCPCLLDRRVLPKVWGGSYLAERLGLGTTGEPTGETWEVFDRPDGSSRVRGGPLAGVALAELVRERPKELLGSSVRTRADGRFPLLLKFVDAGLPLSIQVHPDAVTAAAERESDGGKTEAWVVVRSAPGGWVARGVKPGVTHADLVAAVRGGGWERVINRFEPAVGDVVFLPAGTLHAIGGGVTVFEIQENSDVTYRLHDWDRPGLDGRPRPLHIDQGLRAVKLGITPESTHATESGSEGVEWLVRCGEFSLSRLTIQRPCSLGTEGVVKAITVLEGRGTLGWRSGGDDDPLVLAPGATVLVPAVSGAVFISPLGTMILLVSEPGR
jgi:mannose-6-phosphate isomerase